MTTENRPLSPHLQIYKPQLTSVLSITHRGTGIFLALGSLILACWLLSLAIGPQYYSNLRVHLSAWYGQIALLIWTFCFYYHLSNGIRHLFWNAGLGLEINTTYKSGYIVIFTSIALTAVSFYYSYNCMGGMA